MKNRTWKSKRLFHQVEKSKAIPGVVQVTRGGVWICFMLAMQMSCFAQTRLLPSINEDSLRVFSVEDFYDMVIKNHPVARQAGLLDELSQQEIRMARGNFDPKIEGNWQRKEYDGTTYYNTANGVLKFPTLFPLDPFVGMEQNRGKYLNPERYISSENQNRQVYAGISMPLIRGLVTDERRAALKQARLFGDLMQAEQIKLINKILLEAAKEYWQWAFSYYNYELYDQSVVIASEVLRRVKMNYQSGEAAAVDTVQAKITVQQRLVERQEALLALQNSAMTLSNYLWDSNSNPLEIPLDSRPQLSLEMLGITEGELNELLSQARENHPDLQKIKIKIDQLNVDRKLAQEQFKPKLDLDYYLLNEPLNNSLEPSPITGDNYKLGLDFSFPLFLRKERGKLAQTKIKIASAQMERSLTEREILTQVNTAYNDVLNSSIILSQQAQMIENYIRLMDAELLNLENGESDLFKINVQQEKLLQGQSKFIKLLSEYEKQKAFLYWAAGVNRLSAGQP
jgi:outer membrane protein TolC